MIPSGHVGPLGTLCGNLGFTLTIKSMEGEAYDGRK